jgi:hypothetical protein
MSRLVEADNMRRFLALLLGLALGAAALSPGFALAHHLSGRSRKKPTLNAPRYRSGFSTAAAATVWYAWRRAPIPTRSVWAASGISTRPITPVTSRARTPPVLGVRPVPQASDGTTKYLTTVSRPFWYYDFGNDINNGDHNLTVNRFSGGR